MHLRAFPTGGGEVVRECLRARGHARGPHGPRRGGPSSGRDGAQLNGVLLTPLVCTQYSYAVTDGGTCKEHSKVRGPEIVEQGR